MRRAAGFWAALALFALVPALYLATPRLDSDQAITGLMGLHVLRGEFPVFFWKQDHAGVPEAYGAAVTFSLFGVSRRALGLVPAVAAVGLALALYRTGAVLFGAGAGTLAILFATVVSPYVATHYVLARAYYVEHLLLAQLVLLGASLWLTRRLSEPARCRGLMAMGLAGGLGLYCGFQIATALLPAALALLLVEPRLPLRRGAWLGLGAFALGSLPFWLYNFAHDWATLETGARFQGRAAGVETARVIATDLLPVVLGARAYVDTPPHFPGFTAWIAPAIAAAALALLAARVLGGLGRLRRDPALAGEALLLLVIGVNLGLVWWGRYTQVPRYLLPLVPPLALVLARATQLVWRRSRTLAVALAAAYLGAVGIGLVRDLTVLWPSARAAYWQGRAGDEAALAFLRERGLRHAYAFEYWYAPRLTFDAREEVIVAQPYRDRHTPYTVAVDGSPRPAYVLAAETEVFAQWLHATGVRSRRAQAGPYTVFWDFTPPGPAVGLSRAEVTVTSAAGDGAPETLVDARLDTGWASVEGAPGAAWVEVDLGRPRPVAGLTLVTDQPPHGPRALEVRADGGPPLLRLDTGGYAPAWRDGALRSVPARALTVRFAPVVARRLRLTDLGPAGTWAVAELLVLGPADGAATAGPDVAEGRRLEAAGDPAAAVRRYRDAMRRSPDDPDGYAEYSRLAGEFGLLSGWPAQRAARFARVGLLEEAAELYGQLAGGHEPDRVYAELAERRAEVAAARGDAAAARELASRARAARDAPQPARAVFGRVVELTGYDLGPARVRRGDPLDVTYHWRLGETAPPHLVAWVHFVPAGRSEARFGDDHELPGRLPGIGNGAQHVAERRRVVVPPGALPGPYRVVVGVLDPTSGRRLPRWLGGIAPLSGRVELGTIEVTP